MLRCLKTISGGVSNPGWRFVIAQRQTAYIWGQMAFILIILRHNKGQLIALTLCAVPDLVARCLRLLPIAGLLNGDEGSGGQTLCGA